MKQLQYIRLNINKAKIQSRDCTIDDVIHTLESSKKFKMEVSGDTIILKLTDTLDAPSAITLRNKILKTTVKGVPEIERITLERKNDEFVISTTGSNLAKVLKIDGINVSNVRTNNVFEIVVCVGLVIHGILFTNSCCLLQLLVFVSKLTINLIFTCVNLFE